ncbi:EAL domain-containing protein [Hansschlegelia sp. KR7-227]|uniref:EAL domain-containing protein n=1 Tax=Hansschlegelia sp. KR7-227 TaxID=3400914 RepID=UPI003C0B41F2
MTRIGGFIRTRPLLAALAFAAAPAVALNVLLALSAVQTARSEAKAVGGEIMALLEPRLDEAMSALGKLAKDQVWTCAESDRRALQGAVHALPAVVEAAVVDPAGVGQCSGFDAPRAVAMLSPAHGTSDSDVVLSAGEIGDPASPDRVLVLQLRGSGKDLRLLVSGQRLFPQILNGGRDSAFVARLATVDDTLLAQRPVGVEAAERDSAFGPNVAVTTLSAGYPLKVVVESPDGALTNATKRMFLYANLGAAACVLGALAIGIVATRLSNHPVRRMASGIRRGEFVPYYQPVIDISTGRLVGCEALVRWRRDDGEVVPPGRFIALAEASGEIFPMTLSLMQTARDELAEAYRLRPGLKLGFNLFAGHFDDDAIVEDIRRIFQGSSIRMNQLMVEVTERYPLPDMRRARLVIARLQALGVKVALDDVGAGHGGLSYLLRLGVDVMKIDKMFVDSIGAGRHSVAIVDSLVKLAADLNLELIAEGVETFEQVQYLRGKGVRMAQGYVFAPPLPASSFLTLVEAMSPVPRQEMRSGANYVGPLRQGAA